MKKAGLTADPAGQVKEFMQQLDHPLKAEIQALRKIIKAVNKDILEEIKWNAPSFSYRGAYLVTFNLRDSQRVHLVFHNPMISKIKNPLLEGNYADRRMAYFRDRAEVRANQSALEKVLRDLIRLQSR